MCSKHLGLENIQKKFGKRNILFTEKQFLNNCIYRHFEVARLMFFVSNCEKFTSSGVGLYNSFLLDYRMSEFLKYIHEMEKTTIHQGWLLIHSVIGN